jgi:hypothetical protein
LIIQRLTPCLLHRLGGYYARNDAKLQSGAFFNFFVRPLQVGLAYDVVAIKYSPRL